MSRTTATDGAGLLDEVAFPHPKAYPPRGAPRSEASRRRRVTPLVAGGILCTVALVLLAGGAAALWKDRMGRDAKGFVSFGTTELRTGQYAVVGDVRGDGPRWLYGSTVMGQARVWATAHGEQPLFIGIARTDDVVRYLRGAGYATIDSFEVRADTTHPGEAPSRAPSQESIWATSVQGTGPQTLLWEPRPGDWRIVFMNPDAGADVEVHGDLSAELPVLPWLAGGLLVIGAATGLTGAWVLGRAARRRRPSTQAHATYDKP